jgi:hypothetical protein
MLNALAASWSVTNPVHGIQQLPLSNLPRLNIDDTGQTHTSSKQLVRRQFFRAHVCQCKNPQIGKSAQCRLSRKWVILQGAAPLYPL